MNCFNIREVEALLKGRFFPDLINSHDYRMLLDSSMVGVRFKTNNLSSLNHNLLLFNQHGLLTTTTQRDLEYSLYSKIKTPNSYYFFRNIEIFSFLLSFYEKYFSTTFLLLIRFMGDLYLYTIEVFSPNRLIQSIISGNYMSLLNIHISLFQFFKSLAEYYVFAVFYFHDLNQPLWLIFY